MIVGIVGSPSLTVRLIFLMVRSGSAKATSINVSKPVLSPPIVYLRLPARVFTPEFYPRLLTLSIAILAGAMLLDKHRRGEPKIPCSVSGQVIKSAGNTYQ